MPDNKISAMVAMSGGVDSAVCALLMKQAGFDVTGVTMRLYCDGEPIPTRDGEGGETPDIRDARAVADALGIPHLVAHLEHTFCREVIDDFVRAYQSGQTPNPCVVCNKRIKFGALADFATEHGLSAIATGHYARIERDANGASIIKTAVDATKDQSYMLWSLSQDVLARVHLPLGGMRKDEVRELAAAHGFASAERKDSQDICFLPNGNYVDFIRRYAPYTPVSGNFVDADGHVLGSHTDLLPYTVGQRKGLGIALGRPMYVCRKDATTGDVLLCDNDALFSRVLTAHSINWISGKALAAPLRVRAKVRYAHTAAPATVYQTDENHIRVEFDEPQRAIARGQSVVLYGDEVLLGGGIIE